MRSERRPSQPQPQPAALPRVPTPEEVLAEPTQEPPEQTRERTPGGQTPGRPNVLLGGGLIAGMAAAGLVLLSVVGAEVGTGGLAIGSTFAFLPVIPVLAVFLWLDRNEPEPTSYVIFALAWGATVAAIAALVLNTASVEFLRRAGETDIAVGAVVIAPWVEEAAKGAAVALLALRRRREFDGVVDGLVFAGLCGLGFAFVENILYFGRAYTESAAEHGPVAGLFATGAVFVLRGLGSPFAHPMFTAAIGIGFGLAATTHRRRLQVTAPIIGYLCAVLLHAAWNLAATSGLAGFAIAYGLVMMPVFGAYVYVMVWARRREGRIVARWLPEYGIAGWFTLDEVPVLGSMRERRHALAWARSRGGRAGRRAMRSYQHIATELAFLRDRAARHGPGQEFVTRERDLLHSLAGHRERLATVTTPPPD